MTVNRSYEIHVDTYRKLGTSPAAMFFKDQICFSIFGRRSFNDHFYQFILNSGQGLFLKIVSEYDQEIPQSQTADKPMSPRGRATQQSRGPTKTN